MLCSCCWEGEKKLSVRNIEGDLDVIDVVVL